MESKVKPKVRRQWKFSDFIVILLLVLTIAYVVATLVIFAKTGVEPATLTTCFFAWMGAEGGLLAMIKRQKIKYNTDGTKKGKEKCDVQIPTTSPPENNTVAG